MLPPEQPAPCKALLVRSRRPSTERVDLGVSGSNNRAAPRQSPVGAAWHAEPEHRPTLDLLFFNSEEHAWGLAEIDLEPQILRGIRGEDLTLYHQALVSFRDGRVHGFEALLRWQHPTLGLVPPGDFAPMLESTGLIEPLGEWIIGRACHDLQRLARARPSEPVFVNLNVSHRQLLRVGFAEMMLDRVHQASVDPRLIGVELTETAMIDDFAVVSANVTALRAAGIRIFVDDFGVGYSSLSSLSRLPVDVLEIDRSFIVRMTATERDAAVVRKVVELGHVLDLALVAEGIETAEELAAVALTGCDDGQGYHFARPAPLDDVCELVAADPVFPLSHGRSAPSRAPAPPLISA